MTQEEKRALIATEVMGAKRKAKLRMYVDPASGAHTYDEWVWLFPDGTEVGINDYRPDELRDQLAEVEAALTEEQRWEYVDRLDDRFGSKDYYNVVWDVRTAPPADCVDAIVEMLLEKEV